MKIIVKNKETQAFLYFLLNYIFFFLWSLMIICHSVKLFFKMCAHLKLYFVFEFWSCLNNASFFLVIHAIKREICFYQESFLGFTSTLCATKSSMFNIFFSSTDKTCVTTREAAVFTVIRFFSWIDTLPYSCMRMLITHSLTDSIIKDIEISKPVTIIVSIDVFYDSSIKLIGIF